MSKLYTDIGHNDPDSFLWVRKGHIVQTHRSAGTTHGQRWGRGVMNYWRGRYDPKTHTASAAPPATRLRATTPQWLVDELEARFGGDLKIFEFGINPKRRK